MNLLEINNPNVPEHRCSAFYLKRSFRFFDITDSDYRKGVRHVKNKAKRNFRDLAKKLHPDISKTTGHDFKLASTHYHRICKMKVLPPVLENMHAYFDIIKGFRDLSNTELPSNWEWYKYDRLKRR